MVQKVQIQCSQDLSQTFQIKKGGKISKAVTVTLKHSNNNHNLKAFNIIICRGGVEDTRLEAKDSLSEDRPCRSQGQGQPFRGQTLSRPRTGMLKTKDTATSALQKKSFSGNLQFIGVARIFDWERPKPQITSNDVIKNLPVGT